MLPRRKLTETPASSLFVPDLERYMVVMTSKPPTPFKQTGMRVVGHCSLPLSSENEKVR